MGVIMCFSLVTEAGGPQTRGTILCMHACRYIHNVCIIIRACNNANVCCVYTCTFSIGIRTFGSNMRGLISLIRAVMAPGYNNSFTTTATCPFCLHRALHVCVFCANLTCILSDKG